MPVRQILLVGHTHHDVGYTNSPRLIDRAHAQIVGRVLDLAAGGSPGDPAAFRWTFEVARPVLAFLRDADDAAAARLAALVASGSLSVTGGYLNMTQLPSAFELDAGYALLERIRAAGIPIRTQQHGDVNGLSWGSVDQMLDAGITRLVMALNPDHGRAPFTQPSGFHWEGPRGRRVFVWLSTHYGFGEEWGIVDGDLPSAERNIAAFVEQLDRRADYPWSTAVVHAANDNRWPTALYTKVVRHWNARHPELPMRTATMDEALDALEAEADAATPVVRGEWADWWSHGHGSTAREVAAYREARSFARAAQSTLALAALAGDRYEPDFDVLGYRRGPVRRRDAGEVERDLLHVHEQLLLYGEHTWGSWETYSKPHSTFSHSHHNAKSGFAYDAFDLARDLAVEGWFRFVRAEAGPRTDAGAVVVINPTESPRREIVEVEVAGAGRVRALADVPAFGASILPVPDAAEFETVEGPVAAGRYLVTVDPSRGGVVSLVDALTGVELVDPDADAPLGAVVDERVAEGSRHPMITESPKLFHPDHPGPEFRHTVARGDGPVRARRAAGVTELVWRTAAPGIPDVTTTLVVADASPVIELDVRVSKPERFEPESVFVWFPFLVDRPEFLLETAGAVFAAEREQLPDTSKDWYSIQHAIGVADPDGVRGMLWGSRDAPLVQLGGFRTGLWARRLDAERGHIGSWLMNNLHFTNFQARQEVTRSFRYRFAPAPGVSAEAVRRFGRDLLEPLAARHVPDPPVAAPEPPLALSPAAAVLGELHPDADGARLRLRGITAEDVDVTVRRPGHPDLVVAVPRHGVADARLPR